MKRSQKKCTSSLENFLRKLWNDGVSCLCVLLFHIECLVGFFFFYLFFVIVVSVSLFHVLSLEGTSMDTSFIFLPVVMCCCISKHTLLDRTFWYLHFSKLTTLTNIYPNIEHVRNFINIQYLLIHTRTQTHKYTHTYSHRTKINKNKHENWIKQGGKI